MKKITIFATAIIVSLFLISCGGSGKKKYDSHAKQAIEAAEQFQEEGQAAEEEYQEYLDAKKDLNRSTKTKKSQQQTCKDRDCDGSCGLYHIGDVDNRFQSPEINIYNGNTIPGEKKTENKENKTTTNTKVVEKYFFYDRKGETKVPEPEKVEKVVENKKDDCPTCGTKSFLLFQYGKAFCVEKSTGDVFQYNGELSAADERQLETSTKLKTGLCIHKTGVREYKICNLDGSSFTGEPWK